MTRLIRLTSRSNRFSTRWRLRRVIAEDIFWFVIWSRRIFPRCFEGRRRWIGVVRWSAWGKVRVTRLLLWTIKRRKNVSSSSRSAFEPFPVGETISFVATSSAGSVVDIFFSPNCSDCFDSRFGNCRDRCASSAATFFASNRAKRSANEMDGGGMSAELFFFDVMAFGWGGCPWSFAIFSACSMIEFTVLSISCSWRSLVNSEETWVNYFQLPASSYRLFLCENLFDQIEDQPTSTSARDSPLELAEEKRREEKTSFIGRNLQLTLTNILLGESVTEGSLPNVSFSDLDESEGEVSLFFGGFPLIGNVCVDQWDSWWANRRAIPHNGSWKRQRDIGPSYATVLTFDR